MAIEALIVRVRLEEETAIEIEQSTPTRINPFIKIVINPKESLVEG